MYVQIQSELRGPIFTSSPATFYENHETTWLDKRMPSSWVGLTTESKEITEDDHGDILGSASVLTKAGGGGRGGSRIWTVTETSENCQPRHQPAAAPGVCEKKSPMRCSLGEARSTVRGASGGGSSQNQSLPGSPHSRGGGGDGSNASTPDSPCSTSPSSPSSPRSILKPGCSPRGVINKVCACACVRVVITSVNCLQPICFKKFTLKEG